MTAPIVYHRTRKPNQPKGFYPASFVHMEDGVYGRVDGQLRERVAEGKRSDE